MPSDVFPHGTDGIANELQGLVFHIGQQRAAQSFDKLLSTIDTAGAQSMLDRLNPKGQPFYSWEAGGWVPSCWTSSQRPTSLCGVSAPWTMVSKAGHTRLGPNDWPLTGMGQLLVLVGGVGTVCMWSGDSVINTLGAPLAASFTLLFKEMKWNEFLKWAQTHMP